MSKKYSKVVYLASRYSDPDPQVMRENVRQAGKIAHGIMKKGYAVISPVNNSDWQGKEAEFTHKEWLEMDFKLLERCDILVLGYNWENSAGCLEERKFAEENNIPVIEWQYLPDIKDYEKI
jgi:nucleoside 2-deoxyribosyltransferase